MKRLLRQQNLMKARKAMQHGLKVAIDCSLEKTMSDREVKRLAGQLGLAHALNVRSTRPFHLHLTGLVCGGRLEQAFRRWSPGYENYMIDVTEKLHHQYFRPEELVYLSPDSRKVLQTIDPTRVYVLGGVVDESVDKGLTQFEASKIGLCTVRLPIPEYMVARASNPGHVNLSINQATSCSCVHSLDPRPFWPCEEGVWGKTLFQQDTSEQVLGILLLVQEDGDWGKAFTLHIPRRKGYTFCQTTESEQPSHKINTIS